MTIDLMKLAKQASEMYKDVECSFGTIRVYHVPEIVLFNISIDRPRPEMPTIAMKLATGQTQHRPIKKSDKGYAEWMLEAETYENDLGEYRGALKLSYALKDIVFPDINQPPPGIATQYYNGSWPSNEVLQKRAWLEFSIFAISSDRDLIYEAILELNGQGEPADEGVEEVKKNSE